MRRYLIGGVRSLFVCAGIIALTSISIDATDALRGSQSALSIFATNVVTPACPDEMVEVERSDRSRFCIDRYEVSTGQGCVYQEPVNDVESAVNINDPACVPESAEAAKPWTQVLLVQAEAACTRVGKRLPTAEEWYMAARGTPDSTQVCNLSSGPLETGVRAQCQSGVGAYDMIGGVWEWVTPMAQDGMVDGVLLPPEGYVSVVDHRGVPLRSTSSPDLAFNSDYVWSKPSGEFAVMRGGFHGSRADGGIYTLHAATPLDFAAPTVGFRCMQSL